MNNVTSNLIGRRAVIRLDNIIEQSHGWDWRRSMKNSVFEIHAVIFSPKQNLEFLVSDQHGNFYQLDRSEISLVPNGLGSAVYKQS